MKAKLYTYGEYLQEPKELPDNIRKVLIITDNGRFTVTVNNCGELVINKMYDGASLDKSGTLQIQPSVRNEIRIS